MKVSEYTTAVTQSSILSAAVFVWLIDLKKKKTPLRPPRVSQRAGTGPIR